MNPIYLPLFDLATPPTFCRKQTLRFSNPWISWRTASPSGDARLCLQDAFLARYLQWSTDAFTLGLHLGLSLVHDNVRRGGPQQV